jgi:hypothetical protein
MSRPYILITWGWKFKRERWIDLLPSHSVVITQGRYKNCAESWGKVEKQLGTARGERKYFKKI